MTGSLIITSKLVGGAGGGGGDGISVPPLFVKRLVVGTTPIQVDADTTVRAEVTLFSDTANTAVIRVGVQGQQNQTFPLGVGDSLSLSQVRLSDIYVVANSGTQILHIIG